MKELAAKGVEVVGVSGDSVRTQQLFKKVHELNYTLLADEDGAVAKKFGVPVGKGGSIKKEIDVPVRISDEPLTCVARGTGLVIENLDRFKDALESDDDIN